MLGIYDSLAIYLTLATYAFVHFKLLYEVDKREKDVKKRRLLFLGPFMLIVFAQKYKELFFYTVVWYIMTTIVVFLGFFLALR